MPDSITTQQLVELLNKKSNAPERTILDHLLRLYTNIGAIQQTMEKAPDSTQWLKDLIVESFDLDTILQTASTIFSKAYEHLTEDPFKDAKEFTYGGKTYTIVQARSAALECDKCGMKKDLCVKLQANREIPLCNALERNTLRSVYFVEKKS